MTIEVVLESEDLMRLIVEHLDPTSIVALGRVSRDARTALRAAIRGAPDLLVRAACNACALTKTQLMGWFALTSLEADALPRSQYVRQRRSEGRASTSYTGRVGALPLRLGRLWRPTEPVTVRRMHWAKVCGHCARFAKVFSGRRPTSTADGMATFTQLTTELMCMRPPRPRAAGRRRARASRPAAAAPRHAARPAAHA